MSRRHIALLGAKDDREIEFILKNRGIKGPAFDLVRGLVRERHHDLADEEGELGAQSASRGTQKLSDRERAQAAFVERTLQERLRNGALRIAESYGFQEPEEPVVALFIVMADRLLQRPTRVPPFGSGSVHVFALPDEDAVGNTPEPEGIFGSLGRLPRPNGLFGLTMYSSEYWNNLAQSNHGLVQLAENLHLGGFQVEYMDAFSDERAKTAYPPEMRDWAKPLIATREGRLLFRVSPYFEGPFGNGHAGRGYVDVTDLVPLPWRFAIAQRALECIADLESKCWFIPELEPGEWSTFFSASVYDQLMKSTDGLFATDKESKKYQDAVDTMTRCLSTGVVNVECFPGCRIDPLAVAATEEDRMHWIHKEVNQRVGHGPRRLRASLG